MVTRQSVSDCEPGTSSAEFSWSYARFYELGLTRDSRVIPGLTVVSVLSTSNLRLNWD